MEIPDLTPQRETLLRLLAEAGTQGLPRGRLTGRPGTRAGQALLAALRQLEAERAVGNLGYAQRPRYVLACHFNPLERAYAALLATAGAGKSGTIPLYTRDNLVLPLPAGALRHHGDQALRLLLQEGLLVAAKRGNATFYFARRLLPEPVTAAPDPDLERLTAAYRSLRQEQGYRDVLIADLHRALGEEVPLKELKARLLEMCRQGGAVPTPGDPSLSSKRERKAALEIGGQLYLRIRLGD